MNKVMAMPSEAATSELSVIEQVVMQGDLGKLDPAQRVLYYRKVCESCGLNPYTRPFDYIHLNGKLTLYAKKDATEQLRKLHGISITKLVGTVIDDIYIVTAGASTKDGRTDESTGAVTIGHLKGEQKANALMKAETKAKRRVTLSISGLGLVDETEIESIPSAKKANVDLSTGEIKDADAIVSNPKITREHAADLEICFSECTEEYRKWAFDLMYQTHKTRNIFDLPESSYERCKKNAMKHIEAQFAKQRAESELLTIEA